MFRAIRIPIRIKILLAVLFLVSAVVSIITFTMANLFHLDKKAYVSDLASVIAVHAADEAAVVLKGYRERLASLARIADDPLLGKKRHGALMQEVFEPGSGFVGLQVMEEGKSIDAVYDERALKTAHLTAAQLEQSISNMHLSTTTGHARVVNSTLSPKLQTMTMAVAYPRPQSRIPLVLIGTVRLDELQSLGRQSQSFEVFLMDPDGVLLSHGNQRLVTGHERFATVPELNEHSLAIVKEYRKDKQDMIAAYSRVGFAGIVAGAQIPKAAAYFSSRELMRDLIGVALALLLLSTLASVVWSRRMTRSLALLVNATRVIGKGRFDVNVAVTSRDEMGLLAQSFNDMASELHAREDALQQAQVQLIQSEKMAAFGQLGAGFAHEVKNPLAGILGVVQLALREVKQGEHMHTTLALIDKETRRCKAIIDNLLKFARQEKVEHAAIDVGKVIGEAAAIMSHQMSIKKVQLAIEIEPDLPRVQGNENQLQQVLMNLMLNSQQAMEPDGGRTAVSARRKGEVIEIAIADAGSGIPKDIQARIFEPFFTTKPAGTGTGLGLSVSFGIIKDHHGELAVESEVGKGTTFFIRLPIDEAMPGVAKAA